MATVTAHTKRWQWLTVFLLLLTASTVCAVTSFEHDWTFEAFGGEFGVEQIYSGWIPGRVTTIYLGRPIFTTAQSVWMVLACACLPLGLLAGGAFWVKRK